MKIVLKRLRAELKVLAETITTSKRQFKDSQRGGSCDWKAMGARATAQHEFRHKHIVRCLLRGRTMEQIEQPGKTPRCEKACGCCNKPNQSYIDQLMKECQDEAVSRDQGGSIQEPTGGAAVPCDGGVDDAASAPLVGTERHDSVPEGAVPGGSGKAPHLVNRIARALGLS